MASSDHGETAEPSLYHSILHMGKIVFDPDAPQPASRLQFDAMLQSKSVMELMPVLSQLLLPGRSPPYLQTPLMSSLARLPLRPRGVQQTIEIILRVHPSNANSGNGPIIAQDAMDIIARTFSIPPAGMKPNEWFDGIADQLLSLLDGEGGPDLDKVAAYIIGFPILGSKKHGAPGRPAWKAFAVPMLGSIDPTFIPQDQMKERHPNYYDIPPQQLRVGAFDVARGLQRLTTLLTSHPQPDLTMRLLRPILLPLWYLSSWPHGNEKTKSCYRIPASRLLKTYLQLWSGTKDVGKPDQPRPNLLLAILHHITRDPTRPWRYHLTHDGGIEISDDTPTAPAAFGGREAIDLTKVDFAVDSFVNLLQSLPALASDASDLFVHLCKTWLANSAADHVSVVTSFEQKAEDDKDSSAYVEVKVMQKMMSVAPEKLVEDSSQVLDLVGEVLSNFAKSIPASKNDFPSEETASTALSLLSIILTSSKSLSNPENKVRFDSIQETLTSISKSSDLNLSSTARNLLNPLKYGPTMEEPANADMSVLTDRQVEDKKKYNLAMTYLAGLDSPPPVRVQGLDLMCELIRARSPLVDVPALLILFCSLLQDDEPYVYLRVINSFLQLSQKHPKAVMNELIARYVDPDEEHELDQRLRLGEALSKVVLNNGPAFRGELSQSVCDGLLFVASRRAYKPRAEKKQRKENKLKSKQNNEAEEAWGGELPQLDELLSAKEQEDNEMISQIVTGWESKRGSEDLRIRSSAINILSSGIEANIAGIAPKILSSALDIGFHILTLEPEPEKGILRRAAALLLMDFLRALETSRRQGKRLGFALVGKNLDDVERIMKYVESQDNDGLVRQHAKDVLEALQTVQFNALLPLGNEQTEIQELAGLSIHPRGKENEQAKPRIEEID